MRWSLSLFFLVCFLSLEAQYQFSGYVEPGSNSSVYLSVVEDYRQLNGIYNDQIISRTTADSNGYFVFTGNFLEKENRIYRIHTDACANLQDGAIGHSYCPNRYAVVFIAHNADTLSFPYGFEKQIFCDIQSTNPKSTALIQIDSLKEEMQYAYGEYRSEANKKLNDKKWFAKFQTFAETSGEPLAELYAYAYLSDRSNEIYRYYAEDLKTNPYYDALAKRLQASYPQSAFSKQYRRELKADRFMLGSMESRQNQWWSWLLYGALLFSVMINLGFLYRRAREKRKQSIELRSQLSRQEQVVLDLLLEDKSNKAIAEQLFLSVSTVKTHTHNIYKKLKVQSRDQAKSLFSN
jgi:DNA-binding CsgD family transcriptional regulator